MKIVHIGTADSSGGAARAAFELHKALLRLGHESRMLVGQQFEDRTEINRIGFSRSMAGRLLNRLVLEVETRTGLQYLIQPKRRAFLSHRFVLDADIIHLHNLHGNFFSHRILPQLAVLAPLVWTLHDTWPLTGHCSYNYDCDRWRTGCGSCPNLDEYPSLGVDTTAFLWRVKRQVYARADLRVAAPSKWLAAMARESPLLSGSEVHHIPYGVDTDAWRPMDPRLGREVLGIPNDAQVMMVIALPGAKRKGLDYLAGALERLGEDVALWILIVGGRGVLRGIPGRFPVKEVGYVESAEFMNLCYASADLYVLPTLADNLPLTLLESLAAGTPAVAFDIGGVPDAVRHMETGYLARYRDPEDLAGGIRSLLVAQGTRSEMRRRCREVAVREYASGVQVNRYLEVYELAVKARRRASEATPGKLA